jgi:hypothetical protein
MLQKQFYIELFILVVKLGFLPTLKYFCKDKGRHDAITILGVFALLQDQINNFSLAWKLP